MFILCHTGNWRLRPAIRLFILRSTTHRTEYIPPLKASYMTYILAFWGCTYICMSVWLIANYNIENSLYHSHNYTEE